MLVLLSAIVAALGIFGQSAAGGWSSGRPPECSDVGRHGANTWERAKSPDLRRYCDFVASASSKLVGTTAMAQLALAAARDAERVAPGFATARVLEGRALTALGNIDGAFRALTEARSRDARSLEEPLALLAWARVLSRTGHRDEAADAYRALLPRASALSVADRSAAQVEGGLVAMGRGEGGLDEAAAGLREAVREGQEETRATAVLALALALDRNGEVDQSRSLLEERAVHGDPRTVVASARARELLATVPEETHALTALALEAGDPTGARDEWQKALVDAPNGPWVAYARAHLEALQRVHPKPRKARQ